ncbi:unnamed protein product [Protopolystoma xenopodis]|uniref:Uncharacterized protein n=1 Tax=Protopolystoma xenopodis TaxID=117903 RepID=A0A3S5BE93_9PLAT|nr:unnamed protein product [Protopolystoma xenopodis]
MLHKELANYVNSLIFYLFAKVDNGASQSFLYDVESAASPSSKHSEQVNSRQPSSLSRNGEVSRKKYALSNSPSQSLEKDRLESTTVELDCEQTQPFLSVDKNEVNPATSDMVPAEGPGRPTSRALPVSAKPTRSVEPEYGTAGTLSESLGSEGGPAQFATFRGKGVGQADFQTSGGRRSRQGGSRGQTHVRGGRGGGGGWPKPTGKKASSNEQTICGAELEGSTDLMGRGYNRSNNRHQNLPEILKGQSGTIVEPHLSYSGHLFALTFPGIFMSRK